MTADDGAPEQRQPWSGSDNDGAPEHNRARCGGKDEAAAEQTRLRRSAREPKAKKWEEEEEEQGEGADGMAPEADQGFFFMEGTCRCLPHNVQMLTCGCFPFSHTDMQKTAVATKRHQQRRWAQMYLKMDTEGGDKQTVCTELQEFWTRIMNLLMLSSDFMLR